jgi:hypothetical protein
MSVERVADNTGMEVPSTNKVSLHHSWLHPCLEERPVSYGKGIFAKSGIASGTLLWISGGHVMRVEDEPAFPDGRSDLAMQIHDDFCLGPLLPEEIEAAESINHSCDPNAGFQGQIFLVAMRDIKADEQVCFDYAMVLNSLNYRFDCRCGAKNCRGTISGEDWKRPDLQKRYVGYFQWYLERRIRENHEKENAFVTP